MATTTINEDNAYKPAPFVGKGWQEVVGAKATSALKQLQWEPDDSCGVLVDRTIDDGKPSDKVAVTTVYKGSVGGRVRGLVLGMIKEPMRAFLTTDENAYNELKAELQRNKGYVVQQAEDVGGTLTDNNANALYAWEAMTFPHSPRARGMLGISVDKAKKMIKAPSQLITEGETVKLLRKLATAYDIKNIELTFGPAKRLDAKNIIMGQVAPLDDAVTPYARPFGVKMFLDNEMLLKETVLHEFAHAIELFRNGVSGHGKGFRKIFKHLLKTEMDFDAPGL